MSKARWLVLGALALATLASPPVRALVLMPELPPARAATDADREQAREAYDDASGHFANRRYAEVLAAADRAWTVLPSTATALIRATILAAMGEHVAALAAFLQARDLDDGTQLRARARVEDGLRREAGALRPALGWLRVETEPPGAHVTVGLQALAAPRTLALTPGSWRVTARAEGYEDATAQVVVKAGEGHAERLVLVPRPANGGP